MVCYPFSCESMDLPVSVQVHTGRECSVVYSAIYSIASRYSVSLHATILPAPGSSDACSDGATSAPLGKFSMLFVTLAC